MRDVMMLSMRTTLDIDDDVSAGGQGDWRHAQEDRRPDHFRDGAQGMIPPSNASRSQWRALAPSAGRIVTVEMVEQLLDEP
jgi:hypothetical protein